MKAASALLVFLVTACGRDGSPSNPDAPPGSPDAATGDAMPASACDVPVTGLRAWLEQGTYKQFAAEAAVHPSSGPHFGNVRTYFNPLLDASLKAKNATHPQCAAAVKELYGSSTTSFSGWAVAVKTSPESNGGAGWYWFELAPGSTGSGSGGYGLSLCTSCHVSGKDYIRTPALP